MALGFGQGLRAGAAGGMIFSLFVLRVRCSQQGMHAETCEGKSSCTWLTHWYRPR